MIETDPEKQIAHLHELVRNLGTAIHQLQQAQAVALCMLAEIIEAQHPELKQ